MKRFTLILFALITATVYAQKPVKPNLNKALSSLQTGKLDEAKANIDAAIVDEKLKNDGKTWYYRGLIYASLDTTSKEQFKSLAPDAFNVALEAFAKADAMVKGGKDNYLTQSPNGGFELKDNQVKAWAAAHLNKGVARYQEDDYAAALTSFERAAQIQPTDTLAIFYAGVMAQSAENYDKAIEHFNKYFELGGKSADAYLTMYQIYVQQKEDKEKALEIIRKAREKHPNHPELPKAEIGLLIDLGKIEEAKNGLIEAIKREPENKVLHFYLGYANVQTNNLPDAKKNFEDALKIDPQYFEAQFYLAEIVYDDAKKIKKQMADLGISAEDKRKKVELDKKLVEQLKLALPYWEKAEKLNPSDQEVLFRLSDMYQDLGMDAQAQRIEKRLKELGVE
jgi:tetratricopeptide (TPR) repeat protein